MIRLHQAIIENDLTVVSEFKKDRVMHLSRDAMGFNALELAQLLGREECQTLLDGKFSTTLKVQLKGEKLIRTIQKEEFEKFFNIIYRPFLTFASYSELKRVVNNCPYLLRSARLADENYQWTSQFIEQLGWGNVIPFYVKWIDDTLQYGLFADKDLPEGVFIGEYTGLVRQLHRLHLDHNDYSFHYPTKLWSFNYFIIDALHEGNALRFLNHSETPNLQPVCLIDRKLLHLAFFAKHAIRKDTQLTFNYGSDYWRRRGPPQPT